MKSQAGIVIPRHFASSVLTIWAIAEVGCNPAGAPTGRPVRQWIARFRHSALFACSRVSLNSYHSTGKRLRRPRLSLAVRTLGNSEPQASSCGRAPGSPNTTSAGRWPDARPAAAVAALAQDRRNSPGLTHAIALERRWVLPPAMRALPTASQVRLASYLRSAWERAEARRGAQKPASWAFCRLCAPAWPPPSRRIGGVIFQFTVLRTRAYQRGISVPYQTGWHLLRLLSSRASSSTRTYHLSSHYTCALRPASNPDRRPIGLAFGRSGANRTRMNWPAPRAEPVSNVPQARAAPACLRPRARRGAELLMLGCPYRALLDTKSAPFCRSPSATVVPGVRYIVPIIVWDLAPYRTIPSVPAPGSGSTSRALIAMDSSHPNHFWSCPRPLFLLRCHRPACPWRYRLRHLRSAAATGCSPVVASLGTSRLAGDYTGLATLERPVGHFPRWS